MHRRSVFDQVFAVETAIALAVFVIVLGLLVFAVVRRRARAGLFVSRRREWKPVELCYAGALAAVAAGLVIYTALANREQGRENDRPVDLRVEVSAFQWCWEFAHPDPAGGPEDEPVTARATCRGDDLPTLVVPTGRNIRLELDSRDVIHSFWVPELRYKLDAFPGHRNEFTVRFDREGRWIGHCAEFCGHRHHTMDFWVRAVSPEEYDAWLLDAQTGQDIPAETA
ncbi:cytochrome c oxidase subunit II [Streptomyces aidingensis]|uniref:Cytochrome aa3 subunit 2 n=1 Tax=Streptomyces aidingensis TaxID=910347 RepID=A0A1I1M2U5_9ACTN|nr:cytochrome c oxidase subunit II [Streptomyces aidingensis]SFC79729.1 cytochrome c oxidase subunit 2 [Streptomyces aidingensis]